MAVPGSPDYVTLALTLTFMVGIMELALGFARLGALVNFISHSVVVGFTAGAAFLIAAKQLKHFFGVTMDSNGHFHEILIQFGQPRAGDQPERRGRGPLHPAGRYRGQTPIAPGALHDRRHGGRQPARPGARLGSSEPRPRGSPRSALCPPRSRRCRRPRLTLEHIKQLAPSALAVTLFALTEAVSIGRALAARGRLSDRRQPGVHRPGALEPRRGLFLRLRRDRVLQPQRRQLRGRSAHPAGRHPRRPLPDADRAPGGSAGQLSAQGGHGRSAVPGRLGADRLRGDSAHRPFLQTGDRGLPGDLPVRAVPGAGVRHLRRGAAVPGAVSGPYLQAAHRHPGAGSALAQARLLLRARRGPVSPASDDPHRRLALLRLGRPRGAGLRRSAHPVSRSRSTWP